MTMYPAFSEENIPEYSNHSLDCLWNSFHSRRSLSSMKDMCAATSRFFARTITRYLGWNAWIFGFPLSRMIEFSDVLLILGLLGVVWISTKGFRCVVRNSFMKHDDTFDEPSVKHDGENQKKKLDFIERVGWDVYGYRSTPGGYIDDWRPKELPALLLPLSYRRVDPMTTDELEVYVDYAGSALPTQSQLSDCMKLSSLQILANPHSLGPASARTHRLVEQAKGRILDHFSANARYGKTNSPDDKTEYHPGYEVVFTSGTTDALRIVAEHFPWGNAKSTCQCHKGNSVSSLFVYPQNSHTSVVGMREVVLQHAHTDIVCQPLNVLIETILEHASNIASLEQTFQKMRVRRKKSNTVSKRDDTENGESGSDSSFCCEGCKKHMFVLPMECNFGGDRPDVQLTIQMLQECTMPLSGTLATSTRRCNHSQRWYTLLDIAKAACTSPINLCELNPDFACLSFYKMFGEPTGLGCLFVKRTALPTLSLASMNSSLNDSSRSYVGGGSVDVIVPGKDFTVQRSEPFISLTHGTPHFRGIVALLAGFNELDRRGGMNKIQQHACCLAQEFVSQLKALRHSNGRRAIVIYGDWSKFSGVTPSVSGPTVAFNVRRADGSFVGYNEVSKLAGLYRPAIQLRTGCFCNPGACQLALGLSDDDVIRNYNESGHVCGDDVDIIDERPTGAVRVSFGKDSIWEDLNVVVAFLEQMFVNQTDLNDNKNNERESDRVTTSSCTVVVTELYIFPIKSCAAQRVSDWPLDEFSGRLRFDREFALVDSSGSAMRLQMYPSMALLRPKVDLKMNTLTVKSPLPSQPTLQLQLDYEAPYQNGENDDANVVKVCGNRCPGTLWGDHDASDLFSHYLGVRCWLARHSGKANGRYLLLDGVAHRSPLMSTVSFANEQPLLLVSENAVHTLNEALRQSTTSKENFSAVCSRHFRPNVVVRFSNSTHDPKTSTQYHIEDNWQRVSALDNQNGPHQRASLSFDVVGPCARCAMVDIDPSSGQKEGKTLLALAQYRRRGNGQITFGIFLRICSTASPESTLDSCCWKYIKEGDILFCE